MTQKLFDTHINPITDDSPDFSFYSLSLNINSLRMNEEDYTQVSPLLDRVETTQTRRSMIIQRICALCCVMFAVLDCEFVGQGKVSLLPFNKSFKKCVHIYNYFLFLTATYFRGSISRNPSEVREPV